MKRPMLACLAVTLLMSLTAVAQTTKPGDQTTQDTAKMGAQEKMQKPANPMQTVTGCLQKGDEPGEFALTGEDGKVWELRSSAVKLEDHVGHKVTVTGSASAESKAEEKKEKKAGEVEKASNKEEYGDIRVASLKMVSDSCSK
jgi:hypothetical protein